MNTNKFTQDQLEQMTKTATQQAEDMASYGKAGFEAWMKTTNIWMDGTQTLWKTCNDMTTAAREQQAQAMKQFMSCKTLNDMTETSTRVAQETMEQAMTNATALSEKTIKVCMDTMEPMNDTITKGFQTAKKTTSKAAA